MKNKFSLGVLIGLALLICVGFGGGINYALRQMMQGTNEFKYIDLNGVRYTSIGSVSGVVQDTNGSSTGQTLTTPNIIGGTASNITITNLTATGTVSLPANATYSASHTSRVASGSNYIIEAPSGMISLGGTQTLSSLQANGLDLLKSKKLLLAYHTPTNVLCAPGSNTVTKLWGGTLTPYSYATNTANSLLSPHGTMYISAAISWPGNTSTANIGLYLGSSTTSKALLYATQTSSANSMQTQTCINLNYRILNRGTTTTQRIKNPVITENGNFGSVTYGTHTINMEVQQSLEIYFSSRQGTETFSLEGVDVYVENP